MSARKIPTQPLKLAAQDKLLLTTIEASTLSGYTQDHIGLMLRRGLIVGEKKGRDWFVNAQSLYRYIQSNPKPGRKQS